MKLNRQKLTLIAMLLSIVSFAENRHMTAGLSNVPVLKAEEIMDGQGVVQQMPATLTLTVLDANGLPVIGAAVMKADGSGEITDLDGVCIISLSGSDETLTVVCMGYQTKTLTVGGGQHLLQ